MDAFFSTIFWHFFQQSRILLQKAVANLTKSSKLQLRGGARGKS